MIKIPAPGGRELLEKSIGAGGEGLQPRFGGRRFGVAETVRNLVCSAFYPTKNTFIVIPTPVAFVLELEPVTTRCRLRPRRRIGEKDSIVNE